MRDITSIECKKMESYIQKNRNSLFSRTYKSGDLVNSSGCGHLWQSKPNYFEFFVI